MNNNFYIYYLRRPDKVDSEDSTLNQPFYVGKGSNGRIGNHRGEAQQLLHKPGRKSIKITIIHKLWKQGLDFTEDVFLDGLSEQDAFDIEISTIQLYGRLDKGTGCLSNMTDGGEGHVGGIHSENTKMMISNSLKGHETSEETREKIRNALLGRTVTAETRIKLGNIRRGREMSKEAKQKISIANKNKIISKETREKISRTLMGHSFFGGGCKKGSIPWNKGKRKQPVRIPYV